jgi:DNA-binding response OmpR family regulator
VAKVLVVDDEPTLRWIISHALNSEGYEVTEAEDGHAAVAALDIRPDLIVLDLMMPGVDGRGVLAEVRRRGDTPVILLTALGAEADRITGLDDGADDYLVKPFSIGELLARVRALLRRVKPTTPGLHIDRDARLVRVDGAEVALTRREFDVLAYLADNAGRVIGTSELLERVWQSSADWQDPNTVKEHIRRLRAKVGPDAITTIRGAGYLLRT